MQPPADLPPEEPSTEPPQEQEQRGGWTVLGSDVLYENPWIRVREDQVVQPDGEQGTFGVVELGRAVAVLPVHDDGTVSLVCVFRYTINAECIETVAGGIGEDESAEDAARRELQEEIGLAADELIDLGETQQMTEIVVSPVRLFVARGLRDVPSNQDPTEEISRLDVPLPEAVSWALHGRIVHAATVALVLRAAHLLGNVEPEQKAQGNG
ncbi:MAG: NUDIX hydrolase [Thermomicrobiales bacterium]|nr:NUDIX hydrolase [Chloroflexia bacterium]